jgi:hypothetical protein
MDADQADWKDTIKCIATIYGRIEAESLRSEPKSCQHTSPGTISPSPQ